jgi:hypothetical protein
VADADVSTSAYGVFGPGRGRGARRRCRRLTAPVADPRGRYSLRTLGDEDSVAASKLWVIPWVFFMVTDRSPAYVVNQSSCYVYMAEGDGDDRQLADFQCQLSTL